MLQLNVFLVKGRIILWRKSKEKRDSKPDRPQKRAFPPNGKENKLLWERGF